jgi:hypothetical protein
MSGAIVAMNAATKLGAFGIVLGLSLAGGAALGDAVGPIDVGEPEAHDTHEPAPVDDRLGLALADEAEVGPFTASLAVHDGEATVTVRRDGEVVVTDPYLDAAGHLVAVREGDLAYAHIHPLDDEPIGPVAFGLEVPSAGRYALFFDFQVDGTVHTARFVADLDPTGTHEGAHG